MAAVPANWREQEEVVGALFSPFRSRDVNPLGYDSKMAFWRRELAELCRSGRRVQLSRPQLEAEHIVGIHRPSCLREVFSHLRSSGEAITPAELRQRAAAAQGWVAWGAEAVLWRPLRTAWSWAGRAVWSPPEEEDIVLLAPLKEASDTLYRRQLCCIATERPAAGAVVLADSLYTLHSELVRDGGQLDLVLLELWRRGDVTFGQVDGRRVVKFRLEGERARPPPVTDLERGVLRLTLVEQNLSDQVTRMEQEMEQLRLTAKVMLKNNQKESAKKQFRQWKRSQLLLEKRLSTLSNVQGVLQNIEESKHNRKVLDALSRGTAAVKGAFGDVSVDKVDEVVADCQEALEDQEEMQAALARPMLPGESAVDAQQLESELDALLAGGSTPQPATPAPAAGRPADIDLPSPPSESPSPASQKSKPRPAAQREV